MQLPAGWWKWRSEADGDNTSKQTLLNIFLPNSVEAALITDKNLSKDEETKSGTFNADEWFVGAILNVKSRRKWSSLPPP